MNTNWYSLTCIREDREFELVVVTYAEANARYVAESLLEAKVMKFYQSIGGTSHSEFYFINSVQGKIAAKYLLKKFNVNLRERVVFNVREAKINRLLK